MVHGLPCSGKTTLSTKLFEKLKEKDVKIIILDGDILRKGLNSDLNFSEQDRTENIRRVIELCKILFSQEYSVIVSLITPLNMQRKTIKKELKDSVKCIYLECDIEDCIKRDVIKSEIKIASNLYKDYPAMKLIIKNR